MCNELLKALKRSFFYHVLNCNIKETFVSAVFNFQVLRKCLFFWNGGAELKRYELRICSGMLVIVGIFFSVLTA